ncbi:hypothetical protein [Lysobacter gummosus]
MSSKSGRYKGCGDKAANQAANICPPTPCPDNRSCSSQISSRAMPRRLI